MTRKKYIKQLMALGISKNDANDKALVCQLMRRPYAESLRSIKAWRELDKYKKRVADAVCNVGAAAAEATKAISNAMAVLAFYAGGAPHE